MTNNSAFRTLIIEKGGKLTLKDGLLIVENEDGIFEFAISQLASVIIGTQNLSITSAVLVELQKNTVSLIVCDEKKLPIGEMHALRANQSSAGYIISQSNWNSQQKDDVWAAIVRQKILNSSCLLRKIGKTEEAKELLVYANNVEAGDVTNREAISARTYFRAMFGDKFNRQTYCSINSALNYGYSILASKISRYLASSGYSTALGIHHCSQYNFWNLTYDLVEPFRVFVDQCVYEHKNCEFNYAYKKLLIEICEAKVKYSGKKYLLADAIELYCRDVLASVGETTKMDIKIGDFEML